MTVKEVLQKYHNIEIELLLAHVLKKPREFLFMHPNFILTSKHLNILSKLIKRREKGEPIAYILEYKDFMGHRFKVNKDVLIPRPETEELVERVLFVIPSESSSRGIPFTTKFKGSLHSSLDALRVGRDDKIRILDIGTGSGCIIISIAKALSTKHLALSTSFYASDISKKALKVARQNARVHKVKIKFIHSDILPPSRKATDGQGKNIRMNFDIIVANLPYLPLEVRHRRTKEGGWNEWKNNTSAEMVGLKFEPKKALFTKEKGLYLIRRLLYQISQLKYCPKYIFLEFDPRQKNTLLRLIKKYLPQYKIKFSKDLNKLWRCVELTRILKI